MRISLMCVALAGVPAAAASPSTVMMATQQSMHGVLVTPLVLGAQDPENADLTRMTHRTLFAERQRLESGMPNTWLPGLGAVVGGLAGVLGIFGLTNATTASIIALDCLALVAGSIVFVGCAIWLVFAIVRRAPMARRLDAVNVQLNLTPEKGDDEYLPLPPNARLEDGPAPSIEVATF